MPAPLRFLSPIHRASRRIGVFLEEPMRRMGLRNAEAHLLAYLHSYEPTSVGALLEVFGYPASTLTSILDRLDGKGLIRRQTNLEDRRSFLVHLTARGRRQSRRIRHLVERLEERIGRRTTAVDRRGFAAVVEAIGEATGHSSK